MRPDKDEEVYLDARLHGAVLARPIARSSLLVLLGVAALLVPFVPATVVPGFLDGAGKRRNGHTDRRSSGRRGVRKILTRRKMDRVHRAV